MADGAGMPFDALWLLQNAPALTQHEDKLEFFDVPLCTMFAVVGDRAAGGLLVGRNLDWALPERPISVEETGPDTARTLQVGFTWNTGIFTGMNEHGVVASLQRLPGTAQPLRETPLEIHIARVLAEARNFSDARAMLSEVRAASGIVLLAGFNTDGPHAAVFRYEGAPKVESTDKGFIAAVTEETPGVDEETAARYARAAALSTEPGHLTPADVAAILSDATGEGDARIRNDNTAHSVVFDPAKRNVLVAFPEAGDTLRHQPIKLGAGQ
jgi:hypothetical protein